MNSKQQTHSITFERRALDTGASFPFKARVMEYVVDLVNDPGASASRLHRRIPYANVRVEQKCGQRKPCRSVKLLFFVGKPLVV